MGSFEKHDIDWEKITSKSEETFPGITNFVNALKAQHETNRKVMKNSALKILESIQALLEKMSNGQDISDEEYTAIQNAFEEWKKETDTVIGKQQAANEDRHLKAERILSRSERLLRWKEKILVLYLSWQRASIAQLLIAKTIFRPTMSILSFVRRRLHERLDNLNESVGWKEDSDD